MSTDVGIRAIYSLWRNIFVAQKFVCAPSKPVEDFKISGVMFLGPSKTKQDENWKEEEAKVRNISNCKQKLH